MSQKNVKDQEEIYADKPIPYNIRKHWFGVAAIYFGMTAALSSFVTGGSLVLSLNLVQSFWAILLATIALIFIFYVPMGFIGAKEGLNTYIIGEAAFGEKGSSVATAFIMSIIPNIGWYGIQVSIAADAVVLALGGNKTLTPIAMIVFGVLFAIPAMYGVTSMALLDYISIPIILFITIFGVVKALNISGVGGILGYQPDTPLSIVWGTNLIIGSMVVGASFIADYTRWNKNKLSHITSSGVLGIAPSMLILTVIGAVMALSATSLGVDEPWNVAQVLYALGMPSIALILIIILQWTTNITSAYSSGLALTKVFGWSRFWWTLIAALAGTLLSLGGIMEYFTGFLSLLATFVAPAAGVIISEYYFVSKLYLKRKKGFYWPGIISWLVGGVSSYFIPFSIPAVNGLVISILVYYLFHKIIKKSTLSSGKAYDDKAEDNIG